MSRGDRGNVCSGQAADGEHDVILPNRAAELAGTRATFLVAAAAMLLAADRAATPPLAAQPSRRGGRADANDRRDSI